MSEDKNEILTDLLIAKAAYGLTEAESRQLAELDENQNDASIEMTMAAFAVADFGEKPEAMPDALRSKILVGADQFFGVENVEDLQPTFTLGPPARTPLLSWLGWAVAAVAISALSLNLYITQFAPQPQVVVAPPIDKPRSVEELRNELMVSAPDLEKASWSAGKMPELTDVSGDVVWSDKQQTGYMRLKGLPANDPAHEQYQLWIYEENQGDKTPIDGGVFDVAENGEVIIPIEAKLRTKNPKMFAITIEKPGGVVVSKGEKVAAIAKPITDPET